MGAHGPATGGTVLHRARAYDALTWVLTLGREAHFRDHLAGLARLRPGEAVLEVGCGTGSLALAAKRQVGREGRVCGVDPSAEMLARAGAKAARAGLEVHFDTAAVETLPFADGTFDAVLASLMLHHLTDEGRRQGAKEIARVLEPGGRFLAVDIGAGTGATGHAGHRRFHLLRRFGRLRQHAEFALDGVVPVLEDAGLTVAEQGPVGGPRVLGLSDLRFLLAVAPSG